MEKEFNNNETQEEKKERLERSLFMKRVDSLIKNNYTIPQIKRYFKVIGKELKK